MPSPNLATTMTALRLTDEGLTISTDVPIPMIEAGQALVRVNLAGICSTDLQLIAGYKGGYRGILGHEFVGEVVAVNPSDAETETWIGKRVVGEINYGCGECALCRNNLGKHCHQRQSLGIINWDGAFADYVMLPISNLHQVPDFLYDEQAVFTEPLAAALEILEQVHVTPSSRVYVLGDGRLGLLIAQVLASTQCNLTVIGRHPVKLAILAQRGIKAIVSTAEELATLRQSEADIVIEATGSESGFLTALDLVRPMGSIVLKSTFASKLSEFDLSRLVVDEITLLGSRCGPFDAALRALANKTVDVMPLVTATYPLADAIEAFDHASSKGVLKVLIAPNQ